VADQLMQMSTISPSGLCRHPISSGSSCATDAVCGHHAPSMSPPRVLASASLTGRATRRDPVSPFTTSTACAGQTNSFTGSLLRRNVLTINLRPSRHGLSGGPHPGVSPYSTAFDV
jgi:hypothetical protein